MTWPLLSIVTVTRLQPYAPPLLRAMASDAQLIGAEFVIAVDGGVPEGAGIIELGADRYVGVRSKGYVESVLDEAVAACRGRYVLRLDDDERCSPGMVAWLVKGAYLERDHWCFPRLHLWPDEKHFLDDTQLWPDFQTRLSVREKSGGRHHIHAMSPFGMGEQAPCALEHHKFLVKSYDERRAIAAKWHTGGMTAFSLPEHAGRRMESRPVEEALRDVSVS